MKVLVIGPSDTKSRGGMATVISDIRNSEILKSDFDITVFSSYIDGFILKRIFYSICAFIRFLFIFKQYDLFHIHVASYGSTFRKRYYLRIIKMAGKKAILHIHGAKYLVFYEKLNTKEKNKVLDFLNSADIVIALSNEWKEQFEEKFHITNCYALPNGINVKEYSEAKSDPDINKNSFVFLGRLGERKGIYDLLEAAEVASLKKPEIKIYLAGDGDVEKVKRIVKMKDLEQNIEVLGWVDFKSKIDLLKKSATLVLPSYNEGLPMSILEGMASGKAIISTSVGAIPELIKEENGILISPGNIDDLSHSMIYLSNNSQILRKMSKNNISKVEAEYSVKAMHKRLAQLYKQVLNNQA